MKTYRHRLTREDAATGSILIEKSAWHSFPPPMREFEVDVAGQRFATRIVGEDCTCRPPRHQHLHLEAGHFRDRIDFSPGAMVEIVSASGGMCIRNG